MSKKCKKALSLYGSASYTEAFSMLEDLAKKGHAESDYRIADMYDYGMGTEQSYLRSSKWYLFAAKRGYGRAQCKIAGRYMAGGLGTRKSAEEAYRWYYLCAKNKSDVELGVDAKARMGQLSRFGALSSNRITAIENSCELWRPVDSLAF